MAEQKNTQGNQLTVALAQDPRGNIYLCRVLTENQIQATFEYIRNLGDNRGDVFLDKLLPEVILKAIGRNPSIGFTYTVQDFGEALWKKRSLDDANTQIKSFAGLPIMHVVWSYSTDDEELLHNIHEAPRALMEALDKNKSMLPLSLQSKSSDVLSSSQFESANEVSSQSLIIQKLMSKDSADLATRITLVPGVPSHKPNNALSSAGIAKKDFKTPGASEEEGGANNSVRIIVKPSLSKMPQAFGKNLSASTNAAPQKTSDSQPSMPSRQKGKEMTQDSGALSEELFLNTGPM